jgi:hypothetical protein
VTFLSPTVRDESSAGAVSAVSSVKEIVTVIMALTMTNTLVLLLTGGHYSNARDLGDLPVEDTVFSGLLILTIFRFYHGNIRHLDSVYGHKEQSSRMVKPAPLGGLGVDFFVILAQSILFAVMSFYASSPEQLVGLFIILLASDVTWVLVVQQPSEDRAGFSHQRRWLLNNVLALIAIFAVYLIGGPHRTDFLIYAGGSVMLFNAISDFVISWRFYFPTTESDKTEDGDSTTIFVAAPLTQMLDPKSGQVEAGYREWLEGVIGALEQAGHTVISAHVREEWGERLDSPTTALKTDLEDLRQADAVVAHVGNPPSPGVQFELGAATSWGIPVVLLFENGHPPPYLNPALPAVNLTDIVELDMNGKSHTRIAEAVERVLPAATA